MPLVIFRIANKLVVPLPAEIDISNCDEVRNDLLAVVNGSNGPPDEVVADLSCARFITAAGLSALVDVHVRAAQRGVALHVAAPARLVRRAFQITGLDAVLTLHHDLGSALNAPLRSPPYGRTPAGGAPDEPGPTFLEVRLCRREPRPCGPRPAVA